MYFNLGNSLSNTGMKMEAIDAFGQAVGLRPDYAEALSNLGVLYSKEGQFDKAIANFRKALEIQPDDVISLYDLAMCYGEKGFYKESELCFEKGRLILDAAENPDPDLMKRLLSGHARLLELAKKRTEAEAIRSRL